MNDDLNSPGGSSPTYAPPPAPNSERPASAYLVLGINVVILAAAIWWVWHRYHNPAVPSVAKDPGAGVAKAGGEKPAVGTRGADGKLLGAGDVRSSDIWSKPLTAGKGGGTAKPLYDEATRQKMDATAHEIHDIGVELEVVRALRGAYPSSSVAGDGKNRGVEALLEALRKSGRDAGLTLMIGDTDGDGHEEILDSWGRPLIYFSTDDYATTQPWTDGDAVASKDPRGDWSAKSRFQFWSVGPNGKNDGGSADDVSSWQIHTGEDETAR